MSTEDSNGDAASPLLPDPHDAMQQAWHDYHGPIHASEDDYVPAIPPAYMRGFMDGFQHAEKAMRKALRGHPNSELWGDHGLIAATMKCVDAVQFDSEKAGA